MRKQLLIFALIGLLSLSSASIYTLDLNASKVVDEYGRFVINHGVNAVVKLPPFLPTTDHFDSNNSLCDTDFRNLRDWGFNSIRLMTSWEAAQIKNQTGVDPQTAYNETYFQGLLNVTRLAAKYNFSVLLDAHEDTVARRYCGEGFPDWTLNHINGSFPDPLNATLVFDQNGIPTIDSCLNMLFFLYNNAENVQGAWSKLYDNIDHVQDSFADFWKQVALRFKNESNVLGYEIINEPFTANMFTNPKYKNATENDIDHLTPLYDKVNAQIRSVDNTTLVFFEPTVTDPALGLVGAPGGSNYSNVSVLSFHVYCTNVTPEGEPKNITQCHSIDTDDFWKKFGWSTNHSLVSSLTEFGALSNSDLSAQEVAFLTNITESHFVSWYYWQFKYFSDITTAAKPATTESFYFNDGSLQTTKVKALARSYAHRICGSPNSTEFNATSGVFNFTYVPGSCKGANTEIYLSEDFYYPYGFTANFTGCDGCSLTSTDGRWRFYYQIQLPSNLTNLVTLTVTPINGGQTTVEDEVQDEDEEFTIGGMLRTFRE